MIRNRRMAIPKIIPQTQKGMSGVAIFLIILSLILVFGGGGFAIWWFFIRCPSDCEKSDDCCEGQQCNASKCCGLNNYECSDNEDCCNENCHEGKCASDPCKKISEVCATDQRCCDDLMCINSKCSNCNDEGETCSSNNHCCDDLNCRDGKCSSCKSNDESCTEDSECCTNECKEGKCYEDDIPPAILPIVPPAILPIVPTPSPPPSGPSPPPSGPSPPPSSPYCEWTNIGENCETHCENKGKTCDEEAIGKIVTSNFREYDCWDLCSDTLSTSSSTSAHKYSRLPVSNMEDRYQCWIPAEELSINKCTHMDRNDKIEINNLCVCK